MAQGSAATPAATEDVALVEAARAGSRDAFGVLVERYQRMVFSLAFVVTGRVAESNEITQEVFVRAWEKLIQLRAAAGFRAWLCGITRNVIRRFQERRMGRTRSESALFSLESDLASDDLSPLDRAIQ